MDGTQRNRGLELSAVGEAARNLRLMASATFYDAKLKRTAGAVNQGNDANGVPKRCYCRRSLICNWQIVGSARAAMQALALPGRPQQADRHRR